MPRKKPEKKVATVTPITQLTKPARKKPVPQSAADQAPADQALKLTDLEALRLGKLDAEVEKLRHAIGGVDQAATIAEMQHREQQAALTAALVEFKTRKEGEKQALIRAFNQKHGEYKQEVLAIVEKYGLAVDQFTYDPDTGLLRDLRT